MRVLKRLAIAGLLAPAFLSAQEHTHTPELVSGSGASSMSPGQDAFGAIAEVVRLLEADSSTDWSKVDLEALRQHLIDMHEVTLRSAVGQEAISGGARFTVEGQGRTLDAIRRMARAHAAMVGGSGGSRVTLEDIASGIRLTVLAADPSDPTSVAKIRGLGFIGFLTSGDHHGPHHLALARGTPPASHAHE
jgi:hypothetical protein